MRRALLHALRSTRRPAVRSIRLLRPGPSARFSSNNGLNFRQVSSRRERASQPQVLRASMFSRNFSVALISSLVASGAYFAYRGNPSSPEGFNKGPASSLSSVAHSYSTAATGPSQYPSQPPPTVEDSVRATRKALVLERSGQLFTAEIEGNEPLSKYSDDRGRKVLEMMSPEQATSRLRRNEASFLVGRGKGVVRYDVVQLPSNDPIEDDHVEQILDVPSNITPQSDGVTNNDWMFWGVFDGHSGWTTSAKLRETLISFVAKELNSTYSSALKNTTSPLPTAASIDAAIKRGFVALDSSIVHDSVAHVLKNKSKPKAAELLAPALSGSCALLSFYDSASKTLRVACTGDSRAILGRRSTADPSKWTAHALSTDQTGQNKDEAARMRAEHPGEPNVVRNGRVLGGLEPTRAFGDAVYKWSRDIQDVLKREFFGRTPNMELRTPPYVTAEPIVTTTQVQPESGDFVVMATDGLWEMLSNEEVVGLVGSWLEKHPDAQRSANSTSGANSKSASTSDSWLRSWWTSNGNKDGTLPVQHNQGNSEENESGQRAPIRQRQWGISAPPSSRFVVEDNNVATHLVRNALGGSNREMVCALLTLPSPYSRRYRDDLTVEVIFFGEGEDSRAATGSPDGISTNRDATATSSLEDVKAKL